MTHKLKIKIVKKKKIEKSLGKLLDFQLLFYWDVLQIKFSGKLTK